MALISCSECGKDFSDKASACPNCGCPNLELNNNNQKLIANNAFVDGRYSEAYSIYTQIYSLGNSDANVILRLALSTVAISESKNEVPTSSIDLVRKGLTELKTGGNDLSDGVLNFINDVKLLIDRLENYSSEQALNHIDNMAHQRSVGNMVADALFSPAVSANRNLYEDRRTAEQNLAQAQKATMIIKKSKLFIDELKSIIFNCILEIADDFNQNAISALEYFINNPIDAEKYNETFNINNENVWGLNYGVETEILRLTNNITFLQLYGKSVNNAGFAPPKGIVVLTNYRIKYIANKEKSSFEKTLEKLTDVTIGGPSGWTTHIKLQFADGYSVLISPNPPGSQALFVADIKEKLKL